jgi:hypothetical protein
VNPPLELDPFGGISEVAELQPATELHDTETLDKIRIPPFCDVENRALNG